MTLAARLPEYPWDELAPIAEKAHAFPGGAVDVSVGTPVDPVPAVIQDALAAASNAPGYPLTAGTPELRSAAAGWLARTLDVHVDPDAKTPAAATWDLPPLPHPDPSFGWPDELPGSAHGERGQ